MKIEKLGLHHKDILYQRLRSLTVPLSEYTFPNLYLFRRTHDYEVIVDKEIFVRGTSYDGHSYIMPTVDVRSLDIGYLKDMMRTVDFLFPVPEEWLSAFNPGEFEITFAEGDADYEYTVEKMSFLKGRNLHKKRNLLKQFLDMIGTPKRRLQDPGGENAQLTEPLQEGLDPGPAAGGFLVCCHGA